MYWTDINGQDQIFLIDSISRQSVLAVGGLGVGASVTGNVTGFRADTVGDWVTKRTVGSQK